MTKVEAIEAMSNGHKVSHAYFSDDEWMKINKAGYFEFEDGVCMKQSEFWKIRQLAGWDDEWEIYNQTKRRY